MPWSSVWRVMPVLVLSLPRRKKPSPSIMQSVAMPVGLKFLVLMSRSMVPTEAPKPIWAGLYPPVWRVPSEPLRTVVYSASLKV